MQAFENFITAAKSGGGEDMNGDMAELGLLQRPTENAFPILLPSPSFQQEPVRTRAALAFLLSDKGNFFREFLLDEVFLIMTLAQRRFQLLHHLSLSCCKSCLIRWF